MFTTIYAALTGATGAQLDGSLNEAGRLGTIPCTIVGTNSLTLTPLTSPTAGTPPLVVQPQIRFSGIAANNNSGATNATVPGFGTLNVYKDTGSGPVALTGNEIVALNVIELVYDGALNSGAGGYHLQTTPAVSSGTVTSVASGTGLAGGPITTTGTLALANAANNTLKSNVSGGSAAPTDNTLTAILDAIMSSTQGAVLSRGASVWGASTETSWTPAIAFGGASVGVTYTTQVGQYLTLGYFVAALFNVVLSSKGSSTGSMTLSLPVTAGGTNRVGSVIITNYVNLTGVTTQPFGSIAAGATTANILVAASTTVANVADTNTTNAGAISGMLFYFSG